MDIILGFIIIVLVVIGAIACVLFPLHLIHKAACPPPAPKVHYRQHPDLVTVQRAFHMPFKDGSSELCNALPDELLLDHYMDGLAKLKDHKGDVESMAGLLAETLIVHMEIAQRFSSYVNKKHRKPRR
jgi:hypothetical protein